MYPPSLGNDFDWWHSVCKHWGNVHSRRYDPRSWGLLIHDYLSSSQRRTPKKVEANRILQFDAGGDGRWNIISHLIFTNDATFHLSKSSQRQHLGNRISAQNGWAVRLLCCVWGQCSSSSETPGSTFSNSGTQADLDDFILHTFYSGSTTPFVPDNSSNFEWNSAATKALCRKGAQDSLCLTGNISKSHRM